MEMKDVRTRIEIAAPPERVWGILTDFARWSEWNPWLYRADGNAGLGEQVELFFQGPNSKEMSVRCTIVDLEPNREWRWKYHVGSPLLFRGEHRFTIEPAGPNRAAFAHREVFNGLLVPLFWNEAETRRGFEAMDSALKARAEREG
jgi:hypothetical protein